MKEEMNSLNQLKGLGPKSTEALFAIGINSIEQLQNEDPFQIYKKLKITMPGVSLNFLYALIGAKENIHWQTVKQTRRTEILLRLEEMGIAPK